MYCISVMPTTTKLVTAIHQSMDWKSSVFDYDIVFSGREHCHTVFLGKIPSTSFQGSANKINNVANLKVIQ